MTTTIDVQPHGKIQAVHCDWPKCPHVIWREDGLALDDTKTREVHWMVRGSEHYCPGHKGNLN